MTYLHLLSWSVEFIAVAWGVASGFPFWGALGAEPERAVSSAECYCNSRYEIDLPGQRKVSQKTQTCFEVRGTDVREWRADVALIDKIFGWPPGPPAGTVS